MLQVAALGVSVAQVAGRYAIHVNMIFKWLRNWLPLLGDHLLIRISLSAGAWVDPLIGHTRP